MILLMKNQVMPRSSNTFARSVTNFSTERILKITRKFVMDLEIQDRRVIVMNQQSQVCE